MEGIKEHTERVMTMIDEVIANPKEYSKEDIAEIKDGVKGLLDIVNKILESAKNRKDES